MEKSLLLAVLVFSVPFSIVSAQSYDPSNTIPFHVGVILDERCPVGKTGRTSISIAAEDFYSVHGNYTTRLIFHMEDSGNSSIGAATAALDLLGNVQVQAIIGPQRSEQVVFVSNLGNTTHVPIISFSATSPSLTSTHIPYFIRTASDDSSQVDAISSIVETFGWRRAVLVYEDTSFGTGIIAHLTDSLHSVDVIVPYRSVIPLSATDDHVLKELYKLMTMQTRVFIVHMSPALGSRVFLKAKEIGMMNKGYVWIMTDGLTSVLSSMDNLTLDSMQGVLGVKHYIPSSEGLDNFSKRWERKFLLENPDISKVELSIYGIWAYDTIWALATAVEEVVKKVNVTPRNRRKSWITNNTINLEKLEVSNVGPQLLDELLRTRFTGLAGDFRIMRNQLQSSTFQIINVNGSSKEIGFWTPTYGISRQLMPRTSKAYSGSGGELLGPVRWPGQSTSVPKGWEVPTNAKKLRIGVPVMPAGFDEFVRVKRDQFTNETTVTGYCIDVFEAVVHAMPYAVSYEYIPFEGPGGDMAGSYDDLVYQVYLQHYDAVVGDVTITSNRSQYVDFTLPFTESRVAMIVPVKNDPHKKESFFLEPLATDLWLGTIAFFFYTGFVVWMIEYEGNSQFSGTPIEQLGTVFYFSLSTLVFAHREDVKSIFSRCALIVWMFVVLVLTSSYIASLTSMLTVDNLQPVVTDVDQLKKNEENIGYSKYSFLEGMLLKEFEESKLKPLNTPEEFIDALTKGTSNGGVAVVFHEIPYIKLFLSRSWRAGYTMSDPTTKTAGFGFVFPRGSSLVQDFSEAILNVKDSGKILEIEKKWFRKACHDQESTICQHNLTFQSFRGLYLMTGLFSTFALLISSFFFRLGFKENSLQRN